MANFKELKVNECLSEHSFYRVEKIVGNKAQLVNDNGERIVVDDKYVNNCLVSASQVTTTSTINRTEAANLVLNNPGVVMTVVYNTQVKEADVVNEIMEAYEGSTPKAMEAAIKKAVKTAIHGTERTIVGRHFGDLNDMGRINFIDMEIERDFSKSYDNRIRQVDPRTIKQVCLKGNCYKVK